MRLMDLILTSMVIEGTSDKLELAETTDHRDYFSDGFSRWLTLTPVCGSFTARESFIVPSEFTFLGDVFSTQPTTLIVEKFA